WFVDYYLAAMREAEAGSGRRLLDVLDVHWYPEARGDHRITDAAATTPADVRARLQAPRTLWDPTYAEDSWIGQYRREYLPILTRLREAIDAHYPGTALAVTEYDYGGGASPSGGLAQADVLGAFGRYGVAIAALWGIEEDEAYQGAAFRLYTDFDGTGGAFGDVSVPASTSDRSALSIWAATAGSSLHVILINKRTNGGLQVDLEITGGAYAHGRAWGFGGSSAAITERRGVDRVEGGALSYRIPALTAIHLVLE
ncbi:MAG: glycoside hydrolase family 44 protein, partial [Gemmatimonadota bacterium]